MRNTEFRSFAIFGAMRSGSNLLERNINQFSGLKCHGELFNPAFVGWSGQQSYCGIEKSQRDDAPNVLIDAILADDTKNIPGFRIFRDHNSDAIDQFLDDRSCAKIILNRNPLDSFVSLKIARKTDQWLIHDTAHRKTAQIYFDLKEFENYKKVRADYNAKVISHLKNTDQQFFEVRFDQLTDIAKMNELAAFLGASAPLESLEQPIKRQNPEPLWKKIVNYDEIQQALNLPAKPDTGKGKLINAPEIGTDLSRAYFCDKSDIVFAPIPSAPDGSVRKWLEALSISVENGFGDDALAGWLNNHDTPMVFSILRHPVARAYDVFMRKIFMQQSGGFSAIRETLEAKFGVFLPEQGADLAEANYDFSAHNVAFKQFLAFVHHNLTEKTQIRTDGRWKPQSELVSTYAQIFGNCLTFKEDELPLATAYLANRFNVARDTSTITPHIPDWPITLAQIYDSEMEALARRAYPDDYEEFIFENWA